MCHTFQSWPPTKALPGGVRNKTLPTKPFITAIEVNNYRILRDFVVRDLRRMNVIGGLNGNGKSTILESVFAFMDMAGPIPAIRPFVFRQLQANLSTAKSVLVGDGDEFEITAQTRLGRISYKCKWEPQFVAMPVSVPGGLPIDIGSTLLPSPGVTLSARKDGVQIWERHCAESGPGIALKEDKPFPLVLPNAVIMNRITSVNIQDVTTRFSAALTAGKKKEVLISINKIIDGVEDLVIANFAGVPVVHAQFSGDVFVPVAFVGDGALTLLAIVLAIIEARGGCILLDEFDSAVHYSRLPILWSEIYDFSIRYDCQVFATTHSGESISALVSSMHGKNHNDLAYFRMDRVRGKVAATRYTYEELSNSLSQDWDVR